MQHQLKSPLSNVQQELLKLFAADVPDHYLKELKTETEHDDHDNHSNNSKHARFHLPAGRRKAGLTAKKQLLTDKMSKFLLKKHP